MCGRTRTLTNSTTSNSAYRMHAWPSSKSAQSGTPFKILLQRSQHLRDKTEGFACFSPLKLSYVQNLPTAQQLFLHLPHDTKETEDNNTIFITMSWQGSNYRQQSAEALWRELSEFCRSPSLSEVGLRGLIERHGWNPIIQSAIINSSLGHVEMKRPTRE
jgi:hypothetical protein